MTDSDVIKIVEEKYERCKVFVALAIASGLIGLCSPILIILTGDVRLLTFIFTMIFILFFCVVIVLFSLLWKCPKCDSAIAPGRGFSFYPNFCQNCGIRLKSNLL